ncbi:MAG: cation transporter [Actinomycetes bacterium]
MSSATSSAGSSDRFFAVTGAGRTPEQWRQRGIRLEWMTNAWNAMEVVVTVTLGIQAHSLALVAFGLDSVVEIVASTVVIRNLRGDVDDPGDERVHRSLKHIAGAFWFLAAFLAIASVRGLVLGDHAESTPLGMAYLVIAALSMFVLAVVKRRTAEASGSETLLAESSMTFLDGCLSTGILLALVANSTLGWWWADPLAALVVAGFALSEGISHWTAAAPHGIDPTEVGHR